MGAPVPPLGSLRSPITDLPGPYKLGVERKRGDGSTALYLLSHEQWGELACACGAGWRGRRAPIRASSSYLIPDA